MKGKSIDEVMAAELTQEIAERYFGFRRMIEDDNRNYEDKVKEHSFVLEKRISFDLLRIYIMLRQESLIHDFMLLSGINEKLFYDPSLLSSEAIVERVFEGQRFNGWTRQGRFVRYFLTCYDNLAFHVKVYSSKLNELSRLRGDIVSEIELFYEQNDISAILTFLRSLNSSHVSGVMKGGMEVGLAEGLDKKLQLNPPAPIEQLLPIIKPLPTLGEAKGQLKKLAKEAFNQQSTEITDRFDPSRKASPVAR